MAAPTDVRVEAESITSTRLRWTYPGTDYIAVYRSTDGSSYSEITGETDRIAVGTTEFEDTGLDTFTKYWYKLSDDAGSTFSDVVTVYTHSCGDTSGVEALGLPQSSGDAVDSETFNELSSKVEEGLNLFKSESGQTCLVCVADGALVIDCFKYSDCQEIDVIVSEDVNSVSMPNCEDTPEQTINLIIPPNVTRKVCGFPNRFGFGGDECFRAPLFGGSTGRTVSVGSQGKKPAASKPGNKRSTPGVGERWPSGGSSCTCKPSAFNGLVIKSCNPNNSLKCATTKSLRLIACGGRGPYTWSKTGNVTLQVGANGTPVSTATGSQVIVKPLTNSGSAVAGNAYYLFVKFTATAGGFCENWIARQTYKCDDSIVAASCTTAADGGALLPATCSNGDITTINALSCSECLTSGTPCTGTPQCAKFGCSTCASIISNGSGSMCDIRSAGMISGGCVPCGMSVGATVSVVDAAGTTVTAILRA